MKLNQMTFAAIACGLIFASANANAVVLEGWERPVSKAEMKITQSAGIFAHAKEAALTMTKQDGHNTATGFVLLIDGQSYNFTVVRETRDGCGTTEYVADLKQDANKILTSMPRIRSTLVVQDHSTRFCEDFHFFRWQASLQTRFEGRELIASELKVQGNPKPLFTIQSLGAEKTLSANALLQPRCLGVAMATEVTCEDQLHAMDAGFGVSIATGGCARMSVATMTETTIAGPRQLGTAIVHRSTDTAERRVYMGKDFNLSVDLTNRLSDGKFAAQLESTSNGHRIARGLECEIIR